jgi:hypothetical protein
MLEDFLAHIIIRHIQAICVDLFFNVLCYHLGRILLLIVSIGRYDRIFNIGESGMFESWVGLVALIASVIAITN